MKIYYTSSRNLATSHDSCKKQCKKKNEQVKCRSLQLSILPVNVWPAIRSALRMVILFIHFFFSYHLFDGLMECHRACQNVLMTSIDVFFDNDLIVFYFLVLAASSIANIVKSSLGPVGLDKMLVDDVGVCFFYSRFFLPRFFSWFKIYSFLLLGCHNHQRWSYYFKSAWDWTPSS